MASAVIPVVVLSGPVSVGKTTLAHGLVDLCGAATLNTGRLLLQRFGDRVPDRRQLQELGESISRREGANWFIPALELLAAEGHPLLVVDSIRTKAHLRAAALAFERCVHLHLIASDGVLLQRYTQRVGSGYRELSTYDEVRRDESERRIGVLREQASLILDTGSLDIDGVRRVARNHLQSIGIGCA